MTADPNLSLSQLLSVQADGSDTVFLGPPESYGLLGIYGGHFLGQGLAACFATVAEPLVAHSLHAYFLKGGDPTNPFDTTSPLYEIARRVRLVPWWRASTALLCSR